MHLFAARFAPKILESLAFDLARKKRADTRASETNPDVVNEVSCQDESVGEDATNVPPGRYRNVRARGVYRV